MGLADAGLPRWRRRRMAALFRRRQGRGRRRSISTRCARGRPIRIAPTGGPGIPHPVGQARILFRAAGRAGPAADAGLAARPRGGARRRALAAAPADRARLFPGAHRLFRRRLPAPPRGARRTACCTPTRRPRRGLADGAKVRLFNERGAVGLVLRVSDEVQPGVVLVPGPAPRRRNRRRHDQHAVSPTATPISARARPTRAPSSTSRRGTTDRLRPARMRPRPPQSKDEYSPRHRCRRHVYRHCQL